MAESRAEMPPDRDQFRNFTTREPGRICGPRDIAITMPLWKNEPEAPLQSSYWMTLCPLLLNSNPAIWKQTLAPFRTGTQPVPQGQYIEAYTKSWTQTLVHETLHALDESKMHNFLEYVLYSISN